MANLQQDNPASDAWRFNPRVFLVREWPYLLVLSLAILGIAYTSFAKTPITTYWIVLAPFIGLVCVVTRWRDAENRSSACILSGRRHCIGARCSWQCISCS